MNMGVQIPLRDCDFALLEYNFPEGGMAPAEDSVAKYSLRNAALQVK